MGDSRVLTTVKEQTAPGADPYAYRKEDTLNVSVDYTADDLRVMEDGKECLNVFLYISYDVDLVSHYWNKCADKQQLGQQGGLGDIEKGIPMKNDFTQVAVNILDTANDPTQP